MVDAPGPCGVQSEPQGPDGSPVWVFAALSGERDVEVLMSVIPEGATVLDLGCATGRLANPLAAAGRRLTGVDLSPEMLANLVGVEAVLADIVSLDLGRRFDAVILAGNLVNLVDSVTRATMLRTCRRHVRDGGGVLIERLDPAWRPQPGQHAAWIGDIRSTMRVEESDGRRFRGSVTYERGRQRSVQELHGEVLDDAAFGDLLGEAGLRLSSWVDWRGVWGLARPV
jgi:SAM-dependent methyltransferase